MVLMFSLFQSGLPPNWWQLGDNAEYNDNHEMDPAAAAAAGNNVDLSAVILASDSDNKCHKYSSQNISPHPAHI